MHLLITTIEPDKLSKARSLLKIKNSTIINVVSFLQSHIHRGDSVVYIIAQPIKINILRIDDTQRYQT